MNEGKIDSNLSADRVIELLIQGNARFVTNLRSVRTQATPQRVKELAQKGQRPFCIVLTDSDSRMPVETLLDCGLGELFVVRTLGNLVDPCVIASIEYALLTFDVQLVLIMGNSMSGAIRMTMEHEDNPETSQSPFLKSSIEKIKPSLARARLMSNFFGDLKVRSSVRDAIFTQTSANMTLQAEHNIIENSATARERIEAGTLHIASGNFGISSGQVAFKIKPNLLTSIKTERILSEVTFYESKISEIIPEYVPRAFRKKAS